MKKTQQTPGFALVELMLAIAASSILFITVAMILIMAFKSWQTNNAYANIRRDTAAATDMMTRDIRKSTYDEISVGAGLLTFQSAATNTTATYTKVGDALIYTSGNDSMVLIPEALQTFDPDKKNDGVELLLAIANVNFDITLTNKVFINTRN